MNYFRIQKLIAATLTLGTLLFFIPGEVWPEIIYLRNGKQIEGDIISQNRKSVTLKVRGQRRVINKSQIRRIRYPNGKKVEIQTEEEKGAEVAPNPEESRRLEAARKAEETRRVKAARKERERRRAVAVRKERERRRAEAARKVEERRRIEAVRKAEESRRLEAARKAEEERRIEAARKAEEERRIEAARKAEEERRAEVARKAEEERRAEMARKAGNEKQKQAGSTRKSEEAEQVASTVGETEKSEGKRRGFFSFWRRSDSSSKEPQEKVEKKPEPEATQPKPEKREEPEKKEEVKKPEPTKERAEPEKKLEKKTEKQRSQRVVTLGGALWRSALLPGWGQYYQGRKGAGLLYGASFITLASGTGAAVSAADAASAKYQSSVQTLFNRMYLVGTGDFAILSDPTRTIKIGRFTLFEWLAIEDRNAAYAQNINARRNANIAGGVLAGFYAWNLVDVYLNRPSRSSFSIHLRPSGEGMALGFRMQF